MTRPSPLAKITRPRPQRVLVRTRLFRALDRACRHAVAHVVAPPGSGKTTLVSQYLERRKRRHLWYQVDEGDNDIASFMHHLTLAAVRATPRGRQRLPKFVPEHLHEIRGFARVFFRTLFQRLPADSVLVFDNYQDVAPDAVMHVALSEAVAQIPEGSCLIVISRADLPAAYARVVAHGQVAHVDWSALKLTRDESRRIVRLQQGRRLSNSAHEDLHALCEGWVAGLRLLIEASRDGEVVRRRHGDFVPRVLFAYFASQIFDRMPAREREITVQAALLPKMTIELVRQLTGDAEAGLLLASLYRRNYFITRHGEELPTYQFHPLFREFLIRRAPDVFDAQRLLQVQRSAARVLIDAGHWEDALGLLEEIRAEDAVAALIIAHGAALLRHGRHETLRRWAERLSEPTLERSPWVLYWLGIATTSVNLADSRRYLERAFDLFDAESDAAGIYLAWSAIVNTILFAWDDCHPLDRWIAALDDIRLRHPQWPAPEIEMKVVASMIGALFYRQPNHPQIGAWAARAHELLETVTDAEAQLGLSIGVLYYDLLFGHVTEARRFIEMLQADRHSLRMQPLALLTSIFLEAAYCVDVGEYDKGLRLLDQMERVAEETGVQLMQLNIATMRVYACLSRGTFDAARAVMARVKLGAVAKSRIQVSQYHWFASLACAYLKDPVGARRHRDAGRHLIEEVGAPYTHAITHMILGHHARFEGDNRRALSHFDQAKVFVPCVLTEFARLAAEARIAFEGGDSATGLQAVRTAFALGRKHGLVNSWRVTGSLADLCVRALDAGIEVDYVRDIIRRAEIPADSCAAQCALWPWPIRVYTLGGFGLSIDDCPLQFAGRVQRRPLDLLKAIVAFGGRDVPLSVIIDALWPDADADAAHDALAKAVRRLRSILRRPTAILLRDNKLSLDESVIWADKLSLQSLLAPDTQADWARVFQLYRGDFLAGDCEVPWAWSERERLRDRILQRLLRDARALIRDQRYEDAAQLFEGGLAIDPLTEELYSGLMRCLHARGQRAEALTVYRRCQRAMAATLDVKPSAEIESLHRSLSAEPLGRDPT